MDQNINQNSNNKTEVELPQESALADPIIDANQIAFGAREEPKQETHTAFSACEPPEKVTQMVREPSDKPTKRPEKAPVASEVSSQSTHLAKSASYDHGDSVSVSEGNKLPGDDMSNSSKMQDKPQEPNPLKKRLSGSQKKRRKWLLQAGYSHDEATEMCIKPLIQGSGQTRPCSEPTTSEGSHKKLKEDSKGSRASNQNQNVQVQSRPTFPRIKLSVWQKNKYGWYREAGYSHDDALVMCKKPLIKGLGPNSPLPEQTTSENSLKKLEEASTGSWASNQSTITQVHRSTFKQPTGSLSIAILHANYPEVLLTRHQIETIQEAIVDLICEEVNMEVKPCFKKSSKRQGYLVLTCENEATLTWIIGKQKTLSTDIGVSVKIVPEGDVPVSKIATALFPNSIKDPSEKILRILKVQNGLSTTNWKVLKRTHLDKSVLLVLSVDSMSVARLEKEGPYVHYKFGKIEIRLKGKSVGGGQQGGFDAQPDRETLTKALKTEEVGEQDWPSPQSLPPLQYHPPLEHKSTSQYAEGARGRNRIHTEICERDSRNLSYLTEEGPGRKRIHEENVRDYPPLEHKSTSQYAEGARGRKRIHTEIRERDSRNLSYLTEGDPGRKRIYEENVRDHPPLEHKSTSQYAEGARGRKRIHKEIRERDSRNSSYLTEEGPVRKRIYEENDGDSRYFSSLTEEARGRKRIHTENNEGDSIYFSSLTEEPPWRKRIHTDNNERDSIYFSSLSGEAPKDYSSHSINPEHAEVASSAPSRRYTSYGLGMALIKDPWESENSEETWENP